MSSFNSEANYLDEKKRGKIDHSVKCTIVLRLRSYGGHFNLEIQTNNSILPVMHKRNLNIEIPYIS